MPDVVSFAEVDGQRVDLLPARTVMQTIGNPVVGDVDGDGDIDSDDERLARDLVDRNGDGTIDAADSLGGSGQGVNALSGANTLGNGTELLPGSGSVNG